MNSSNLKKKNETKKYWHVRTRWVPYFNKRIKRKENVYILFLCATNFV